MVRPQSKRRRKQAVPTRTSGTSSSSEFETAGNESLTGEEARIVRTVDVASDDGEDATVRANNAYTGATNTIGSVHQRHWFLSLDRLESGFTGAIGDQQKDREPYGPKPFVVMGREVELSVVTGRNADQIMSDEGVLAYAGRKMWRPIVG